MAYKFIKMHGCGNDFILLDASQQKLPENLAEFSKTLANRHFGIGADQVLIKRAGKSTRFAMQIFNVDGGEVEMCGNGIRCFLHSLFRENLLTEKAEPIETLAGIIVPELLHADQSLAQVRVNMGQAVMGLKAVGIFQELPETATCLWSLEGFNFSFVSMGNPHSVCFVEDVEIFDVLKWGSFFESHKVFAKRCNIEFAQIINKHHVQQRTFERGAGETLACGTGACAVAVAGIVQNKLESPVQVQLKGGLLKIEYDQNSSQVYMTGESRFVFQGEV